MPIAHRISVDNAGQVLHDIQAEIDAGDADLAIDLSAVTHVDSAGVAVLIEGVKIAKAQGKVLRYQHPQQQLLDLSVFLKVREMLFGQ